MRVPDAQWAKIEPHLPRPRRSAKGGRPRVSNRDVVDGILWVLKTGACWRDLPEGYPPAARPVGDACGNGTRRIRGSGCGGPSSASSTRGDGSGGRTCSSTAYSCRRQNGLWRRENQARQGLEVDGGGRRPGCSSGNTCHLGQPRGSLPCRRDAEHDPRPSDRTRASTLDAAPADRGPGV